MSKSNAFAEFEDNAEYVAPEDLIITSDDSDDNMTLEELYKFIKDALKKYPNLKQASVNHLVAGKLISTYRATITFGKQEDMEGSMIVFD